MICIELKEIVRELAIANYVYCTVCLFSFCLEIEVFANNNKTILYKKKRLTFREIKKKKEKECIKRREETRFLLLCMLVWV
jgi:hypothetical protein